MKFLALDKNFFREFLPTYCVSLGTSDTERTLDLTAKE